MVTIAVGQFAARADRSTNLAALRDLAVEAVAHGASLLALPEYAAFTDDALGASIVKDAEDLDGPFADAMREVARENGMAVVVGMNERIADARRVYNTVLLIAGDGSLAGVYRKTHLYDAFGQRESEWIQAAELVPPATMRLGELTVGVQTCYDLRFPEVTRRVVDAGADVVIVPAQWMPGPSKVRHWRTLTSARAIENTVYVCAVGQIAPRGIGVSRVVDPAGRTLAELHGAPGVAVANVSRDAVESVRMTNPSLNARRYAVVPREPLRDQYGRR